MVSKYVKDSPATKWVDTNRWIDTSPPLLSKEETIEALKIKMAEHYECLAIMRQTHTIIRTMPLEQQAILKSVNPVLGVLADKSDHDLEIGCRILTLKNAEILAQQLVDFITQFNRGDHIIQPPEELHKAQIIEW